MKFIVSYKNANFRLFVFLQIIGWGYRHELGLNIEERRRWTLRSQWKSPCGESGWLKSSMKSWEIKRWFQNHLNSLNDRVYLMLHSMIMKLQSGEDRAVKQKGEISWMCIVAWMLPELLVEKVTKDERMMHSSKQTVLGMYSQFIHKNFIEEWLL